jgi:hypothetical protein
MAKGLSVALEDLELSAVGHVAADLLAQAQE